MTEFLQVSPATARDLALLAKQLKAVAPAARKALPKRLREAAKPVLVEANKRKPSAKIKIGVRVKLSGRNGASIKVRATSPKNPPLAGLLEAGSKGNAGVIRHPVFGNRNRWVSQPTRPYLAPAGRARRDEMRAELAKVIDDLAKVMDAR